MAIDGVGARVAIASHREPSPSLAIATLVYADHDPRTVRADADADRDDMARATSTCAIVKWCEQAAALAGVFETVWQVGSKLAALDGEVDLNEMAVFTADIKPGGSNDVVVTLEVR